MIRSVVVVAAAAAVLLAGCGGGSDQSPARPAAKVAKATPKPEPKPREVRPYRTTIILLPGGEQVLSACDGHGWRVFVHDDTQGAAYDDMQVVRDDEGCTFR